MKTIHELKNSEDILDRQEWSRLMKECILGLEKDVQQVETPESQERASVIISRVMESYPQVMEKESLEVIKEKEQKEVEWAKELIARYKKCLVALKKELSEYDIYKQKVPYVCNNCKEVSCVCYSEAEDTKIDLSNTF